MNVPASNRPGQPPNLAAARRAYQGASGKESNRRTQRSVDDPVQLLAQRIAELPDIQRKIVAMYYFENLRFAEIALASNLTESQVGQIHAQTMLTLRARSHSTENR